MQLQTLVNPDGPGDATLVIVFIFIFQDPRQRCPSGYLLLGHSCYHLDISGATWSAAKTACENDNSYLAVLNDETELQTLKAWLTRGKELMVHKDMYVKFQLSRCFRLLL